MNPLYEYINIKNYSPFSHINEVSKKYQFKPFMLPFIKINKKIIPVHPDTLNDLKIDKSKIEYYKWVYPTSSFRTVYEKNKNVCYKLGIMRKITRGIRSIKEIELTRSVEAANLLKRHKRKDFIIISEKVFNMNNEYLNYIIRKMPNKELFPWFYVIASSKFDKETRIYLMKKIIDIWMDYAKTGIIFESFHTQNILIDEDYNIYYRDLSDVRCMNCKVLKPSYWESLKNYSEFLSITFDRSVCSQNIEHLFNNCKDLTTQDELDIKDFIKKEIKKYNLEFPNYSLGYPSDKSVRIPVHLPLTKWRT